MSKSCILALDVALSNTGVAVWDSHKELYVHFSTIKTEIMDRKSVTKSNMMRCNVMCQGLRQVIQKYPIEYAVCELPVGGAKSAKALKGMMIAFGVVNAVCYMMEIPIVPLTRHHVKKMLGVGEITKSYARDSASVIAEPYLADDQMMKKINEHVADAILTMETHLEKK